MPKQFSSVEAAIEAFRQGKIVIVVDAEDRENEGDFVCAASAATTETVNFMLRHGRGQVCMSILPDVAKRLALPMMVETNSAPLGTAFTVPVDHRSARTGITAGERATAIAAILGSGARRAISMITLWGGLASTVFWPVGHALGESEHVHDRVRLARVAPAAGAAERVTERGVMNGDDGAEAALGILMERHPLVAHDGHLLKKLHETRCSLKRER